MTLATFRRSLGQKVPPAGLSPALTALWWLGKHEWDQAHRLVADEAGADCAWVHAHIHRIEGDLDNAGYWYRRARREPAHGELAAEWAAIAAALLAPERR
jgi:hypothetical protein